MNKQEFITKLFEAFEQNGLKDILSDGAAEKLYQFKEMLVETNKCFNLTAITDDEGIILKHFVDCAAVTRHINACSRLVDVGCGAGFPSMPIAILREDVQVTSLDSTAKKINFINESAEKIGLNNIKAVVSRAEDHAKDYREGYDVAISRAVARLNILDEICIPLVRIDGIFIAMKSSKSEEELTEASNGIKKLGATLKESKHLILRFMGNEIERDFLVFKKTSATPLQYPRNYSQISKKPL